MGGIGDGGSGFSLTKVGAGTLAISGTSTYSGATTIGSGSLALTGNGSVNSSSSITVSGGTTFDVSGVTGGYTLASGQTLQGTGVVTGNVTTATSATIAPGTSVGTLTFTNDLDLSAGGSVTFEVSTTAGSGNDQVVVGGSLTLSDSTVINIDALSDGANLEEADYVLFTCASAPTMASTPALNWVAPAPGNYLNYSVAVEGNDVVLKFGAATAPTVTAAASPDTFTRNQATTITATVTPGSGTVTNVSVNLSEIGGPAFAELVQSDVANVWTNTFMVSAAGTTPGNKTLTVTATDTTPLSSPAFNLAVTIVAANQVWDGGGGDDDWSTGDNWASGNAPGHIGDAVTFSGTTRLNPNVDTDYSITGLAFDATAGSFNLGSVSSTLTLSAGTGIVNSSANPQTLSLPMTLAASQTINAAAGDISVSGSIGGAGGLTKTGNGTVTLSGVNAYSGKTIVNGGVVSVSADSGFGAAPASAVTDQLTLDGGTLEATGTFSTAANRGITVGTTGGVIDVAEGQALTYPRAILGAVSGQGVLTKSGAGTLILSDIANDHTYGALVLNDGTLGFGKSSGLGGGLGATGGGVVLVNGGTIYSSFAGTARSVSNTIVLNGDLAVGLPATTGVINFNGPWVITNASRTVTVDTTSTITINGAIGEDASGRGLTKAGPGQLTLNAANTYSGDTTVSGGVLFLNPAGAVSNTTVTAGELHVANDSALGTGVLTMNGGAIVARLASRTLVNDVSVGGDFTLNGSLAGGNILTLSGDVDLGGSTRSVAVDAFNGAVISGEISNGGLTKSGSGPLTLSGANTFTGDTTINGGTVLVNGSLASGSTVAVNGGTLGGTGTVEGAVTVDSGGTLTVGGSSGTPGTLTINNTLTLGGNTTLRINKGGVGDLIQAASGTPNLVSGGTLSVYSVGGALAGGDTFALFSGYSFGGTAPTAGTLPTLASGLNWYLGNLPVDGSIIVNRAPTASALTMGVSQGDSATLTIIGGKHAPADADGNALAITGVGATSLAGSSAVITGGGTSVIYTAPNNASGSDSFSYTVSDGRGGTVTETVTVTVSPAGSGANIVGGSLNVSAGVATMQAFGIPGALYRLQYTESLNPVNWQDVLDGDVQAQGNGTLSLTDSAAGESGSRFYRTRYVSGP